MKLLMSGNEAIAMGARRAGVKFASGYPGTPSTEILENLASCGGISVQWSPNEKVALEVAIGASLGGARALVAMKHVGLNVAADPLFTLAYTGVNAGLVVVTADDPGMHSSQNEQDNRFYALAAKVPMLEPSDSAEALEFAIEAFKISEEYDLPVLLRTTTRISHSKSVVCAPEAENFEAGLKTYVKDASKYVMIPANARERRRSLEDRLSRLRLYSESAAINKIERGSRSLGVVSSGVAYQYAKEAFPEASHLKLGLTNPIPEKMVREFASSVDKIAVVEELSPYLEERIKLLGIDAAGKGDEAAIGELNVERVRRAFGLPAPRGYPEIAGLPARPPVLCPGCPHRGVFYALRKLKVPVMGDIGCYTLAVMPPLEAMDMCICMGAGVGSALGFQKATGRGDVVAVIGDSTFVHSGIAPLIDTVYNGGATTVVILDNGTTAMTGRQDHPGTGRTLRGDEAPKFDFEKVVKALGVDHTAIVDPYDLEEVETALKEAIAHEGPSVIIARRPCVLLNTKRNRPFYVKDDCTDCRRCLRLGCPAISNVDGRVSIESPLCTGCGVCSELCPFGAIEEARHG